MSNSTIPPCFYRVSIKALILDDTRTKFLIMKNASGPWGVPGGGLEHGAAPQEDLPREILEEMGLCTTWVAKYPSYFSAGQSQTGGIWIVNVIYEATVEHLHFIPSDVCVDVRFVSADEALALDIFPDVRNIAEVFNPRLHQDKEDVILLKENTYSK